MTDDRLSVLLDLWAAWVSTGSWVDGFPSRSPVLCSTAGVDFEDMAHESDTRLAEHVQACIDGLPLNEQAALSHRYTEAVWRFPRLEFAVVLQSARLMVREALERRGVE